MDRGAWLAAAVLAGCGAQEGGGAISSQQPPLVLSQARAPRLRVATFNVNFGVAGRLPNIEALEHIDADVVLLQETTHTAELRILDALADRYPHALFRDCCRAGGLGVLSKHPITDESYLLSDTGWFPAWLVTVETPVGSVQLLDVHLRPPVSDSGSWVKGYFSTRDDRREEIEGFWAAVDPQIPTIVAGDFNEGPDGKAVRFLADQGLRSALPQVDPEADTWHWPLKLGELRSMLDHIVYDPRLALLHVEVHEAGVSDHFPVFADFALPPGED